MLVKSSFYDENQVRWDVVDTPNGQQWTRCKIPSGCLEILKENEYEVAEIGSPE